MEEINQDNLLGNEHAVKEKHTFKVKGVWMPSMVFFDEELTDADKRIFGVIFLLDGKDGCFATNKYLATLLNYTPRTITAGIASLIKKGFVKRELIQPKQFRSPMRTLHVLPKVHKYRSPFPSIGKEESSAEGRSPLLPPRRSPLLPGIEGDFHHTGIKDKQRIKVESKDSTSNSQNRITQNENFNIQRDHIVGSQNSGSVAIELRNKAKAVILPTRSKPEPYKCPRTVQPFMDLWKNLTGRKYRKDDVYRNDCLILQKLIRGKYLNEKVSPAIDPKYYDAKLSIEDWELIIQRFALIRNNVDYWPPNKKNLEALTIGRFLYNSFPGSNIKSYFIECLESEPKKIKDSIKSAQLTDPDPDKTNKVIELFKQTLGWNLDNGDRNLAIKCTKKLTQFFDQEKDKILHYSIHYNLWSRQVNFLIQMLEHNERNGMDIKPEYVASDLTYSKFMPSYLRYVGSYIR